MDSVTASRAKAPGSVGQQIWARASSLRGRLSLAAALLTFLGLALGMTVIYWSLFGLRLSEMDRESRLLAEVILEAVILRPEGTIRVPGVVESYLTDENGASSAQVYLDGQLSWEGGVLNAPRPLDPEGLLDGRGERTVGGWRVYTVRDELDEVITQVGRPLAPTSELLEIYRTVAIPVALLLALASSVIAWYLVGLALRPLRKLARAAAGFEAGGEIPEVPGSDEPAVLARSFANLLGRLRGQREREREFLAYASHELRTPISALRAGLEAARSGRMRADTAFIDRLYGEALRMESLARNLLTLSRAEVGQFRGEWLGLDELASAAYDRFFPLALERGLDLRLETEPTTAYADERLLTQALDNLLANALRFTKQGTVTIRSGRDQEGAFLEVADTGPGFTNGYREGLGMRVVGAVAQSHRARLTIRGDAGASVRISLPDHEVSQADD